MNVKESKELDRIAGENGGLLLADQVVAETKRIGQKSPIYKRFEWDNTKAAHQHRLQQARQLITYHTTMVPGIDKPVQTYYSLTVDRSAGGGYRRFNVIMSDTQMRDQLIDDFLRALNTLQQKFGTVKELSAVFVAMNTAVKKVRRKAA